MIKQALVILIIMFLSSCGFQEKPEPDLLGNFDRDKDLYLANFDLKTDVDDVHSVAAVATMLADPRFSRVRDHAVAGAYGIQEGLYVPAEAVFDLAFGDHWSDAHEDFDKALDEVLSLSIGTLESGGSIWISEAGQSDFSAALIRNIQVLLPEYVSDARLREIWTAAVEIANKYNAADGRYLNEAIQNGGLDFSDVAETTWIFGFNDLTDANDFFEEFSDTK